MNHSHDQPEPRPIRFTLRGFFLLTVQMVPFFLLMAYKPHIALPIGLFMFGVILTAWSVNLRQTPLFVFGLFWVWIGLFVVPGFLPTQPTTSGWRSLPFIVRVVESDTGAVVSGAKVGVSTKYDSPIVYVTDAQGQARVVARVRDDISASGNQSSDWLSLKGWNVEATCPGFVNSISPLTDFLDSDFEASGSTPTIITIQLQWSEVANVP